MKVDEAGTPERFRYCDLKEAFTPRSVYGSSIRALIRAGAARPAKAGDFRKEIARVMRRTGFSDTAAASGYTTGIAVGEGHGWTVGLRSHAAATELPQGGDRSRSCAAVRCSRIIIGPPRRGHRHTPSCLTPGSRRAS